MAFKMNKNKPGSLYSKKAGKNSTTFTKLETSSMTAAEKSSMTAAQRSSMTAAEKSSMTKRTSLKAAPTSMKAAPSSMKDTDKDKIASTINVPSVDIDGGQGGRYTTSYDFPFYYGKPVKKTHSDGGVTMADGTYVSAQDVEKYGGIKYYGNKEGRGRYASAPGMTDTRRKTPQGDGSGELIETTKDGVVGAKTRNELRSRTTGQN